MIETQVYAWFRLDRLGEITCMQQNVSYRTCIYFPCCFVETCRVTESEFVYFLCTISLSAAQNAPPAGGQPAGGAFRAADKQRNCALKVNKHNYQNLMHRLKSYFQELMG